MSKCPILRVARPSDDLEALLRFYQQGLGFALLYRFEDHDGFDGIRGHVAGRAPTWDNLLVFYFPDAEDWQSAVRKMREAGFEPVSAFNPYWDREGVTFEDPDGYRIVLQKAAWTR